LPRRRRRCWRGGARAQLERMRCQHARTSPSAADTRSDLHGPSALVEDHRDTFLAGAGPSCASTCTDPSGGVPARVGATLMPTCALGPSAGRAQCYVKSTRRSSPPPRVPEESASLRFFQHVLARARFVVSRTCSWMPRARTRVVEVGDFSHRAFSLTAQPRGNRPGLSA